MLPTELRDEVHSLARGEQNWGGSGNLQDERTTMRRFGVRNMSCLAFHQFYPNPTVRVQLSFIHDDEDGLAGVIEVGESNRTLTLFTDEIPVSRTPAPPTLV